MTAKQKLSKLSRSEKALQMFRTGKIATRTEDGWLVPGHNGNEYEVRTAYDQWTCSCPDSTFRGNGGAATDLCKHIQFVRLLQESERVRAVVDIAEASPVIDKPCRVVV